MSRVLILTGMHRSATSLIASLFQRAGVHLGAQLLEANAQNPRGFFEDVEFYEFHERALRERGKHILVDRAFQFVPTAQENKNADALIESRAQYALWGWKDPRTSLFLEFWREHLLASDRTTFFLLVYRHPFDVLLSLMRRNQLHMLGLLEGLEAWYAYNRALAEFRAQHPQQTLLCQSYSVLDQIDAFNARLHERFGMNLQLDNTTRDAQYQPHELQRASLSAPAETILQKIHPDACALYAELNRVADLSETRVPSESSNPALEALAQFAASSDDSLAARTSLLFALVSVVAPNDLEKFTTGQAREMERLWREKNENAAQRDAWQHTAEERARIIREQQVWAQERMGALETLEAHPVVRALKKLGGV